MSSEEEWEAHEDDRWRNRRAQRTDDRKQQSDAIESDQSDATASYTEVASNRKPKPRKRGRLAAATSDDDDFESQPAITKWFRQVPGPLQDVMKQQQIDLQHSMDDDGVVASGRSSGHAVHISTVFDDGPWVEMCDFLGIPTLAGELYGGIKMGALQHTVSHILDDDVTTPKIPRLLVLIKSMRYVDEEIVAVFHDPTGEVEGYFHRDLVEQIGPALIARSAVALRQVSVFTPTDAVVGGTSKHYLNIIPRNVIAVFPPSSVSSTLESITRSFNEAQAQLIKDEDQREADAVSESQHPHDVERGVFAHADVRTTTSELSFISQRQVVQRHPPVLNTAAQADSDAETSTGGKQKKKKKTKEPEPSGLGRWQWHQLAQKKAPADADEDEARPSVPRRTFMSGGRFTELLSQHLQARRAATTGFTSHPSEPVAAEPTGPVSKSASTTPSKAVRFSAIPEASAEGDDVDDDW